MAGRGRGRGRGFFAIEDPEPPGYGAPPGAGFFLGLGASDEPEEEPEVDDDDTPRGGIYGPVRVRDADEGGSTWYEGGLMSVSEDGVEDFTSSHDAVLGSTEHLYDFLEFEDSNPFDIECVSPPIETQALSSGAASVRSPVAFSAGTSSWIGVSGKSPSSFPASSSGSATGRSEGGDADQVVGVPGEAQDPGANVRRNETPASGGGQEAEVMEEKPQRGAKGIKVPVMTNFLHIELDRSKQVHEYIASFSPNIDDTKTRKRVIFDLDAILGSTRTFDGTKLYLPIVLSQENRVLMVPHPNEAGIPLTVTFRHFKVLQLDDRIQFYNVLMRRVQSILGYTEISRTYYDGDNVRKIEQHKLEVWPGFITSIQVYERGLMMCLDSTYRVLRSTTVLDAMNAASRGARDEGWKRKYGEELVGKVVMTRYNCLTYTISGIAWNARPTDVFKKDGVEMPYTKYYADQYGISIADLNQPLILSRKKARKNDPGGVDVNLHLVPELCFITGLTQDLTSNFHIMRDIIAQARTSPKERIQAINRFVVAVLENDEASTLLTAWGLTLKRRCVESEAFGGPNMEFSPRYTLKDVKADFTRDSTSQKCFMPVKLGRWAIYCTQEDQPKAQQMLSSYKQVAGPLGIAFGPDPEIFVVNGTGRNGSDWVNVLRQTAIQGKTQFIVCIFPVAKDELYAAVKNHCVVESHIPSQVILAKTLAKEKPLHSIMQKIALQINCKLGGSGCIWALRIPLPECIMFVGVDSYHDPQRKKPSVLALVSSLTNECTKYYSRIVPQGPDQEGSDALRPVFTQALAVFYQQNKRFPDRIVFFRDGVGDGQFEEVKSNEIPQLKSAAAEVCPKGFKFAYIIVQKRINEGIFFKKGNAAENPAPGTSMDHTINRKYGYDFFMISQQVGQGTVSPSRYTIVDDGLERKPDMIQRFSYITAFMYFNWVGTIRIPVMCQYAHKLAMLAGQHLRGEP